jgi:mannose-1-phosphate guanylyltransferase
MSIEKEVFPGMAEDGELFAMVLQGYWMDIGQPMDFLQGMQMHMNWLVRMGRLDRSVIIHPTASVHETAVLGPGVVIGPNVIVEEGARMLRSCVMDQSVVKAHSVIIDSIIGWRSTIASWAHVETSVLGEDVQIGQLLCVRGARILPHKSIGESIWQEGKIVM